MKIAVIGCGNMAGSIVRGLHSKGLAAEFFTYTPSYVRAKELAGDVDGVAYKEISDIPEADYYIAGFKPQQLKEAAKNLKGQINPNSVVISLLAGATIAQLEEELAHKKVVRYMANTPILFGQGICLEQASRSVTEKERAQVKEIFQMVSSVYSFDNEEEFNYAMLIAASGPAYLMTFAAHFSSFLKKKNIPEEMANSLVMDLFAGTSVYMQQKQESFAQMASRVTSKGGVTAEVLQEMADSQLENIFSRALERGAKRAKELIK